MNKDDTILIDRIKFLEADNARLKAENKQRRPIFGPLDVDRESKSVAFIIISILIVAVTVMFTITGVARLWPENTTTLACNEERVQKAYEECLKQYQGNTPSNCSKQAQELFCKEVKIK